MAFLEIWHSKRRAPSLEEVLSEWLRLVGAKVDCFLSPRVALLICILLFFLAFVALFKPVPLLIVAIAVVSVRFSSLYPYALTGPDEQSKSIDVDGVKVQLVKCVPK